MKKLKLQMDDLHVESYETSRASRAAEGTVNGHAAISRLGEQTCGGTSCDVACFSLYQPTCRYVCY